MLFRKGKTRTYEDNIFLAAFLSFIAGCVNVSGFIAFDVLTTNITGHVAFFAKWLSFKELQTALYFVIWMLLFLLGSFMSGLLVEWIGTKSPRFSHALPMLVEFSILVFVGTYSHLYYDNTELQVRILGGSLLFAMGFQNAMVTKISGSIVRTTHLTGMTTDLGIELASLLRNAPGINRHELRKKIGLQTTIIFSFFAGGVCGGYSFQYLLFHTFYVPAAMLLVTLVYDTLRHGLSFEVLKKEKAKES